MSLIIALIPFGRMVDLAPAAAETAMGSRQLHTGQNVRSWPIASIRTHTLNGRYRRHSGHCSALARNGSVANDPKRTNVPNDMCGFVVCRRCKQRMILLTSIGRVKAQWFVDAVSGEKWSENRLVRIRR
jgi:hypothetical protein